MIRFGLLIATVWVASLCSVTSAQDRGFASAIEWSPDGETIAIASSTGVWFFDTEFNELGYVQVKQGGYGYSPRSLDWNATGEFIAIGYPMISDSEMPIQIIDVNELKVITEIVYLLWTQVEWHPTDNLLAAGSWSGEAHVWDAFTGEARFDFEESDEQTGGNRNSTMAVCWFAENVIAVVTQFETYLVDVEFNKTLQSFDIGTVTDRVDCNRNYKILAGLREIVDLKTGARAKIPYQIENNSLESLFPDVESAGIYPQDMEFAPDGGKILVMEEGCSIHVFDGNDGKFLASIRGGIYFVQFGYTPFQDSLAWHPDGSRFAAVGQFGGIRIWDAATYDLLQRFDGFQAGYGELGVFGSYSEEELNQIEAFEDRCIEALNSELPKK